jgi:hydroxyacid-oxoacid transhydrogenase
VTRTTPARLIKTALDLFIACIYYSPDIPALVDGTLPRHRVTKLSPRPAGPEELSALFEEAMVAW